MQLMLLGNVDGSAICIRHMLDPITALMKK